VIDGAHEADPDDGSSDVDTGVTERVGNTGPASLSAEQAFQQYVLPEIDVLGRVALSLTRHSADASYVALAEALGAALVTSDRRLAEAPGNRADVVLVTA